MADIPNLFTGKFVDSNGYLTAEARGVFTQLFQELQNNISNEGFFAPIQKPDKVAILDNDNSRGALLIQDNRTDVDPTAADTLIVNLSGTFRTVQTV
ncbi:MAG: hypothetical protein A3E87_01635 [Gammaproteobacteria bacterium RIFCSPHIGHO2_12_FULL_35_23]|nr:MAG: hypothetical protein A3E87_01635 [Gammaproteobacteria bacterium RIFCSPHIGHO2_12_FULL_35_23]